MFHFLKYKEGIFWENIRKIHFFWITRKSFSEQAFLEKTITNFETAAENGTAQPTITIISNLLLKIGLLCKLFSQGKGL